MYREAAKALHPDLATTDEGRRRRTAAMAALNDAYERGDEEAMRRIMMEEQARRGRLDVTRADRRAGRDVPCLLAPLLLAGLDSGCPSGYR